MANKPGPKVDPSVGPLEPKTVLLDDLAIRQLLVIGGGNLSNGIRKAARGEFKRYQTAPPTKETP